FNIINVYYDSLKYYNNHKVLGNHPIVQELGGGKQRVILNKTPHYSYFYYKGKMGENIIVENYIEKGDDIVSLTCKYPTLGYFLSVIRLFFYNHHSYILKQ